MSTPTASDSDEVISWEKAERLLYSLSESKLDQISERSTYFSTGDEKILSKPAAVLAASNVVLGVDRNFHLHFKGKPLEISVCITPRSRWAYNNGPDGNLAFPSYQYPNQLPDGVTVIKDRKTWIKVSELDGMRWETQLFDGDFRDGAIFKYYMAVSGSPANDASAAFLTETWQETKKAFDTFAENNSHKKKLPSNGPTSSMWAHFKRSIFVKNNVPMDEGRASDYFNPFGVFEKLSASADVRFNRIPEVLVYDWAKKDFHPMSFNHLHMLGNNLILKVTFTPRGYLMGQSNKDEPKELHWDFRLINIRVLGKKEPAIAVSPSKKVRKRAEIDLSGLDDDDDDDTGANTDKRQRT